MNVIVRLLIVVIRSVLTTRFPIDLTKFVYYAYSIYD